ncbi:hypothetical protein [Paenibacillus sp. YN15]|uniref:hypothetical protein n=1 Tax=Paenibacillus sp. YN15 TaxID=1742774 RepID=UPI000DCD62C2|nr:hypothetical protein [Paenibacillus sp. YN15]RAU92168.1 hypothetical protein DQG13_28035 [Paenibacillus sp. YN15]
MPTLHSMDFPQPTDWQEFERMTKSYCNLKWPDHLVNPYGRNGQSQNGVDLYVKNRDGAYIGIQCKLSLAPTLPIKTIEKEAEKAIRFQPTLIHYYIATTAKRNARTQEQVNLLNQQRAANGLFNVDILFWEDIIELLKSNRNVLTSFYP